MRRPGGVQGRVKGGVQLPPGSWNLSRLKITQVIRYRSLLTKNHVLRLTYFE